MPARASKYALLAEQMRRFARSRRLRARDRPTSRRDRQRRGEVAVRASATSPGLDLEKAAQVCMSTPPSWTRSPISAGDRERGAPQSPRASSLIPLLVDAARRDSSAAHLRSRDRRSVRAMGEPLPVEALLSPGPCAIRSRSKSSAELLEHPAYRAWHRQRARGERQRLVERRLRVVHVRPLLLSDLAPRSPRLARAR
jgi:hypothetical protein